MDFVSLPQDNNTKIDEKMDFVETTKQEQDNQDLLYNIIEKQAKEFEAFGKRMSLELQTSYQEYVKQQNELKFQKLYPGVEPGVTCCECKEKTALINSLKVRVQELENDSKIKNQSIKKLQKDVQSLFDILVKKGKTDIEKTNIVPAKITITTAIEEEYEGDDDIDKEIDNDRLSVESIHYNENIKDCYSDSAIDLFTDDDDDTSTTGGSVKSDDSDYAHTPSEWLDISPTMKQRAKLDKRNLDRWNSRMASNGLLPIRLVGKVDTEREKKYQTHRKRYSTSAIWLKTYENNKQKQNEDNINNKDEKLKVPSFSFSNYSFGTKDDSKKKEKETSVPISLKSSVSTSVSELSTCSIATTSLAATSLQSYEILSKEHKNTFNSKTQKILSQYK